MPFKLSKFLTTLVVTLLAGSILIAGLRAFGIVGPLGLFGSDDDDVATLVKQATDALEAVRRRQPGERRPASYDAVLAPLDRLLAQTKRLLESESFDPVADFEKVRSLALPVIDLATQADQQAKRETGFLSKDYRFNDQKGEAIQYLASTMWERINRRMPQSTGYFSDAPAYPPGEMSELRRWLDQGIEAASDNPDLYYIRGVLNRAEGLFGPAARDLERAVEYNKEYIAAWNTLGLVYINLKNFEKAEESLERARALSLEQARRLNVRPGEEHTAILYNLATFHEGLAAFYTRENRITPTVESQTLMAKHTTAARRYLEEFLEYEPPESPDARAATAKLQGLGR